MGGGEGEKVDPPMLTIRPPMLTLASEIDGSLILIRVLLHGTIQLSHKRDGAFCF